MNIGILLALMAFLAFRGNGIGSSAKVEDPKNGLSGYTGFAYFPLFAPALPMEDDIPYVYDRSDSGYSAKYAAFVQTVQPKTYFLVVGYDWNNTSLVSVWERTGAEETKRIGVYNPDLRMKVVDGVPETAEASE